ncbi:MAG TPA: carboxypeptidase-like regulatory domain-containing protein [Vicinamibacterales bacterium]|nr:carboxypeptidase-like regulatory domain-containing protein [Vicinamibacterales bacterium]
MKSIALFVLMSAVVVAQAPNQRPATQGNRATAGIRGRVTAAGTNRPIRGARIALTAPELPAARNFVADVDGRFAIDGLPPGRYTLTGSAPGYVALSVGQTRPFEPGRPIALLEGQIANGVTLTLPRGGALAGAVRSANGRPLISADVSALRVNFVRGVRQFEVAGRADTNDLGEFRIYGLTPGTYYLAAAKRFSFAGRPTTETGYPPMFFPGTRNAADARPVTVAAGQTTGGIDLVVDTQGSGSVGVTIKDMNGQMPRLGTALAFLRLGGMDVSSFFGGNISSLDLRGRQVFLALPPGEYIAYSATGYATQPGSAAVPPQAGAVKIQVNGNVGDVELNLSPMQYATGRIVFDGGGDASLSAADIKLSIVPADPAAYPFPITATIKSDLTFALPAPAGRQLVRANVPSGWGLKAVRFKGEDVVDTGLEFGTSQDLDGIEVELTRRLTQVNGTVRGARNEPVDDYTVVVFSRDPREWTGDSRSFAIARPDQAGSFTVTGLKPGEYFAAALSYLNPGEAQDPALLNRLQRDASSFVLADAANQTLTVRLVP